MKINEHRYVAWADRLDVVGISTNRQKTVDDVAIVEQLRLLSIAAVSPAFENVFFVVIDLGVQDWIRVLPTTVEVVSGKITTIVPVDNTVRIQHWHYLPHKHVSK